MDPQLEGKEIAARVMQERGRIIERWAERARATIPAAQGQSRTALIDSLPVFLGELADALAETTSRPEMLMREKVLGKVHGHVRALMREFSLDQVIQEYDLVREVLFEVLEERSPLSPDVRRLILDAVQAGVRNATEEFVGRRELERRALESEARRIAGEVADRERLYDAMLGATTDSIYVIDRDGRLTYLNRAASVGMGAERAALIGKSIRDVWGPGEVSDRFEARFATALGGANASDEMVFKTPSGDRAYEYILTPLRTDANEVVAVVGVARDVEDRRRAELERDQFFSLSPDLLCIAGTDGYLKRVNAAFTQTLGWTEQELLAAPFLTFVHPDDVPETSALLQKMEGGGLVEHFENRYRCRDGTFKLLAWSTSAVAETGLLYAAARDITERRAAQLEVERRAQFEKQLIGIVSHDLRNPLQNILMSSAVLSRRDDLDEPALRSVMRIRTSAERAARLTHDLLDFTQARLGGGIPVQPSPANLQEIIQQALPELEATFPGRRIEARYDGLVNGRWDPDRLGQVVTNLVSNALKYSPPDSVVTIETTGTTTTVSLRVHNDGPRIAPEWLPFLFEPLQRGSRIDSSARSVGLGLYIVKQIVTAHGGNIRVDSSDGEGTAFTVTLPRGVEAT